MSQCPSPHEHNRDMILLHESTQNVLKTHALVSNAIPTRPRARNQMDADYAPRKDEMKFHLIISPIPTHSEVRRDEKSEMPAARSPISPLSVPSGSYTPITLPSNLSGPYCVPWRFAVSPFLITTNLSAIVEHEATQTDLIERFPTQQMSQ